MSPVVSPRFIIAALLAACASLTARAQTAPAAVPVSNDEAITLSVFEVRSEKDVGYQAANTTSGSRLNTALKDTAAAITPFTKEFLDDIGATSLTDLLTFSTSYEPDFNDGEGFNSIASRRADTTNAPFRVRGQTGGVSIDLAETGVPVDLADIERVEIASGPNSILFGTGATGGIVTLATKRANLNRNSRVVRGVTGSWDFQREEIDFNQVIRRDGLAVRLFGVNGSREGWRHWDFEDTRRLTGAVTFRPWKKTVVSGSYGRGTLERHITQPLNAGDGITLWRSLGSQVSDVANLAGAGTAALANVNRYTFMENDGTVYNMRSKLASRGVLSNAVDEKPLAPESLSPFDFSFAGPGARYTSKFTNKLVRLEQRIGEHLMIEAAYQRNQADNTAFSYQLVNNMMDLQGDPNLTLPLLAGGTTPNPRARQLFMEVNWRPETARIANEVSRLTGAYELDLGKRFGSHRFAGLFETGRLDRARNDNAQVLVDQNNVPISNAAAPENAANSLWRRHYFTEGKFEDYYMSDPSIPAPPVTIGTRQFNVRNVAFSEVGNTADRRDTRSLMFAMQNFWFNRRLVTTYGYRVDDTVFREGVTARISPTDPRVLSGQRIANEWDVVAGQQTRQERSFHTQTLGGVYHVNPRFSLFYNQSTNVGTPRFDRTVIPGILPPASEGRGRDGGVMIDLRGDERYFARFTVFQTTQMGDASIAPGGAGIERNYYTTGINDMLDHLLLQRRITQAEYDQQFVAFSAMTIDTVSKGAELEFVANPTRDWTLRLSASYTYQQRENYFPEREPYLTQSLAFVRSRDDKTVMASGLTIEQQIASLLQQIVDTANNNEGDLTGARPVKGNFTTRYRFADGRLKGVFVGGALIYQSRSMLQQTATGGEIFGHDIRQVNLFLGDTFRVPGLKSTLRLQLNVNNLMDSGIVEPGRYTTSLTGLRRVYLREPRNYRFTATFEF